MQEKLSLSTQQKLQQRLSPLQVQFVRMLEMNRVEIEEEVRHEIDENPAIEVVDSPFEDNASNKDDEGVAFTESADDIQRADYRDDDDVPSYRYNTSNSSADDDVPEGVIVAEGSIIDYLEDQLTDRDLNERERLIATYIIGNIDENGYLPRSSSAIADDIMFQTGLDVDADNVEDVLQVVRDLDPAGVGARDLRECLLLQLERRGGTEINMLAYRVIDEFFEEFSKKHFEKISSALNISQERVKDVMDDIRTLNPKPGSLITGVSSDSHSQQIIPDFSVEIDGDTLQLTLINSVPDLQIEESFSAMYENLNVQKKNSSPRNEEAATFVKQKYESASGFIKILKQRQETLFNTMRAIVNRQKEFFLSGEESDLKPMVLKDISDVTGQDVSVISRATANKYVVTQWGVFSLKFFFNEGLQHESGEEVSSKEIQSILKNVISEENKKKPYSDEQLCAILRKNGYEIARRTVAKYREKLSIPVARLRKEI